MPTFVPTIPRREMAVEAIVTVHYFEYAKNYVFEGEKHDFWEFLYVDKGEVEVMADSTGYRLRQGEMIFHKPDEFHNVFANGVVAPNLVVVSFVCRSAAMAYFEGKVLRADGDEQELLSRLVSEARDAFASPLDDPGTVQMIRASSSAFGSEPRWWCPCSSRCSSEWCAGARNRPGRSKRPPRSSAARTMIWPNG